MRTRRAPSFKELCVCVLLCGLGPVTSCGQPAGLADGGLPELRDGSALPDGPQPLRLGGVSPAAGPTVGGIKLTLSGAGFATGATVTVGGEPAEDVEVWSSTLITATLPRKPGSFGYAQIAVRNPNGSSVERGDLFWYQLSTFPFRTALLDPGPGISGSIVTVAGDFNLDRVPDLAVAGGLGVTLLLSNGQGGYGYGRQVATGAGPYAVATGDVDADGRLDVVVANGGDSTVSVLLNDGQGNLTRSNHPAGQSPIKVGVADANGDGYLDVVTLSSTGSQKVLYGNGRGAFAAAAELPAGVIPGSVFVPATNIDFNGDTFADRVSGVTLTLNDGTGVLGKDKTYSLNCAPVWLTELDTMRRHTFAVADINKDARPDLIASTSTSSKISFTLTLGDAQTGFAPAQPIPLSGLPGTVFDPSFVVADVNGDQNPDLVFTVLTPAANFLAVALGDGTGRFSDPTLTRIAARSGMPLFLTSGDWNNDQKLDLATTEPQGLIAYLNDGTGQFTPSAQVKNLMEPAAAILAGDFNGDQKQDLVVGGQHLYVSVYVGDGQGGFQPRTQILTDGLNAIAVGDLNGDNRTDLAVANFGGALAYYLGNQATVLSSPRYINAGTWSYGVTIADFNQDRKSDVVLFGIGSTARLYWGDGKGGFSGFVSFLTRDLGVFGHAVDVDGDQRPDLITRNDEYAANARILLNSAQ